MSQVEFYDEVAGLASFVIEGEEYSEDGESAVVPVAVLKRTDIASIPYNFDIEICESQSDAAVVIKIPAHFKRIGEKKFHVFADLSFPLLSNIMKLKKWRCAYEREI